MTDNEQTRNRKANKAALLEAAKINAGLAAALETQHGRALLWWWLEHCGCFRDQHTSNALNTAYALGLRAGGLALLDRIALVDPAGFVRMQTERIENVYNSDPGSTRSAGTVARDDDENGYGTD